MNCSFFISIASTFIFLLAGCSAPDNHTSETAETPDLYFSDTLSPTLHLKLPDVCKHPPVSLIRDDNVFRMLYPLEDESGTAWAQAISPDLFRWQTGSLDIPFPPGFSTSSAQMVWDKNGTAVGKSGKNSILVTLFSGLKNNIPSGAFAYSEDAGNHWTLHSQDPAFSNPAWAGLNTGSIFFHEPSGKWVMVSAADNQVAFHASGDLLHWEHLSNFGADRGSHAGRWERAGMMQVRTGDRQSHYWVLWITTAAGHPNGGTGVQYLIGQFDGMHFQPDESFIDLSGEGIWLDQGRNLNSCLTIPFRYDGYPETGYLCWMDHCHSAGATAFEHVHSFTLPRLLFAGPTAAGLRLFSQPHPGISDLRQVTFTLPETTLQDTIDLSKTLGFSPVPMEILLDISLPEDAAADVGILLYNDQGEYYRVGYRASSQGFYSDRTHSGNKGMPSGYDHSIQLAPRLQNGQSLRMRIFIDRHTIELFADWGATTLTDMYFSKGVFSGIALYSRDGAVRVERGLFFQM